MLRSCPVCLQPHESRSRFSRGQWTLKDCPATGLVYLENPPGYAALETEFAFEVTHEQERARRRETEPLWSRLSDLMKSLRRRLLPNRNKFMRLTRHVWQECGRPAEFRVLDVGCGWGNMLEDIVAAFVEEGVQVMPHGVEISKALSRLSGDRLGRLGGRVLNRPATEGILEFPERHFHCALLSSYLEHETAPGEVLSALRSRLVPGGQVLIKVPNYTCWNRRFRGAKWCGFRFPDHVNYFTPAALRRQVENAGLAVARMGFRDRLPLSDNMYLVAAAPRS